MTNTSQSNDDIFFSASPEALAEGVLKTSENTHVCLICYEGFETGRVYEIDGTLYEGARAAREHVRSVHGSTAIWLAGLNKRLTGLTDTQRLLLTCMQEGLDDKETASRMDISASTVRNHRFQMRERAQIGRASCMERV